MPQETRNIDPDPAAVTVEDVAKQYRRSDGVIEAAAGISFSIPRGSVTVITGPSGAGKSTLLFLIAGLAKPSRGRVRVLGMDLNDMSDDALADMRRRHIGFVFQNYHLLPTLTVLENVMLPTYPVGPGGLKTRARALHCIERVGLEKRIHHLPGELSGGEQQRAAIARALMNDPELILADEPTGNLDADSSDTVLDLLLELARAGERTVVITSHDRDVARRCENRIHIVGGKAADIQIASPAPNSTRETPNASGDNQE